MLPDPGADPPGHGRGHLAADRPDARPGRRAAGARGQGRLPQLDPGRWPAPGRWRPTSWPATWTCSTWRRSGCGPSRRSGCSTAPRSACSRSTRRTASRSGVTTSGPTTSRCPALHERWPSVPRIALTATATRATRAEIASRLNLESARHFVASFDRPNIRYRIEPKAEPLRQLLTLLRAEHPGDAGIVYCLSRASVEKTAAFLERNGIPALPYHAGLDGRTRTANQARFLREDGLVMVATIAFGMGIDKPDVRFVAHLDLPKSVEGYYQETGRAGPGRPAGHRVARLRPGRRRAAAQADRCLGGRPRAPAPALRSPGRDARAVRDRRLPPRPAARLLRRGGGAVRQLRHLPVTRPDVGRHGRGPEAAVGRPPAAPGAAPAVRGRPGHRHPARPQDAEGDRA